MTQMKDPLIEMIRESSDNLNAIQNQVLNLFFDKISELEPVTTDNNLRNNYLMNCIQISLSMLTANCIKHMHRLCVELGAKKEDGVKVTQEVIFKEVISAIYSFLMQEDKEFH